MIAVFFTNYKGNIDIYVLFCLIFVLVCFYHLQYFVVSIVNDLFTYMYELIFLFTNVQLFIYLFIH